MKEMSESFVAYAEPLLEKTDGSDIERESAYMIAELCWTLAQLPKSKHDELLTVMRPAFNIDDATFTHVRETTIAAMIERFHQMFKNGLRADSQPTPPPPADQRRFPETGRNHPCPCNSGKKYKRCCG